jgi:hypothetical protein
LMPHFIRYWYRQVYFTQLVGCLYLSAVGPVAI